MVDMVVIVVDVVVIARGASRTSAFYLPRSCHAACRATQIDINFCAKSALLPCLPASTAPPCRHGVARMSPRRADAASASAVLSSSAP